MGQHVTVHGKTTESWNGQDGKWVPIRVNAGGQLEMALIQGELTDYNRLAGGPIVQHTSILNADAVVMNEPAILYGVKVVTAGTSITVWDSPDSTTTGDASLITAEATTVAGAMLYPAGPGVGVLCTNGIYLDITGGTYIVYYVEKAT